MRESLQSIAEQVLQGRIDPHATPLDEDQVSVDVDGAVAALVDLLALVGPASHGHEDETTISTPLGHQVSKVLRDLLGHGGGRGWSLLRQPGGSGRVLR